MPAQRYKLSFRNKSVPQKRNICGRFIHGVAKVPPEQRAYVALARLQDELADASAAVTDVQALQASLRTALVRRDRAVAQVCLSVRHGATGYRVQAKTSADLAAAGLDLVRRGHAGRPPVAPRKFRVPPATQAGTVRLRRVREFRRSAFEVQISTDPNQAENWQSGGAFGSTSATLTGLPSGVRYWFRVLELNRAGRGPWSQPLPAMAA